MVKGVELFVVAEHTDTKGGIKKIRVVDWQTDDGKSYKLLEKREFYTNEEGELRNGKAKGFNSFDMKKIKENWDEIIKHLE